jgi:hypothetical protein
MCFVCLRALTAAVVCFPSQYYAGHEIFLDGKSAVFVLVVRLDEEAVERERQLRYWLRFIKGRMVDKPERASRPTVVLVGSKRDAVEASAALLVDGRTWTSAWGNKQLKIVSCLSLVLRFFLSFLLPSLACARFRPLTPVASSRRAISASGSPLSRTSSSWTAGEHMTARWKA